jgi:hypothetical protein
MFLCQTIAQNLYHGLDEVRVVDGRKYRAGYASDLTHEQTLMWDGVKLESKRTIAALLVGALGFVFGFANAQAPAWMTHPPKDTPQFWYGIGEGPDPEAARRSALRAVSSKLRSNISGSVTSTVRDNNGKVTRSESVQVSEEVLKTEFTHVEVEATSTSAVGVLMLIRVDMPNFVRDTRAQLEVVTKPIAEVEGELSRASALEQFMALRRVGAGIDQAINYSLLLTGAGAEIDGRAGYARFSDLKQRGQQLATRLVFELRAKPEDADIVKVVSGAMAGQGIRSSTTRTSGANVLTVDTQARQDELFGDKLIRLTVRFTVVDDQGRSVASREHQVSGSSRQDFRGARESAVRKLSQRIGDASSLAVLGFRE